MTTLSWLKIGEESSSWAQKWEEFISANLESDSKEGREPRLAIHISHKMVTSAEAPWKPAGKI